MNTATLVRHLDDWDTDTALYRLDPPLPVADTTHEHVVLSALHPVNGDHGCIALAATDEGQVTSWEPIAQSDSIDHADLLRKLGYEVAT